MILAWSQDKALDLASFIEVDEHALQVARAALELNDEVWSVHSLLAHVFICVGPTRCSCV